MITDDWWSIDQGWEPAIDSHHSSKIIDDWEMQANNGQPMVIDT